MPMTNKLMFAATSSLLLILAGCAFSGSRAARRLDMREIASPAPRGATSPRVTATRDGGVLLTWLEPADEKVAALRSSSWRDGSWTAPATIVGGQPFSRHPSVSPNVIALSERNLIAYWSQEPAEQQAATREVDVYFTVSTNGGSSWGAPQLVNEPGTGEENSYPSAAAIDSSHAELIWLDGANWKKQNRMRLMSRTVQSNGSATKGTVIDEDTCTCCPTSLEQTEKGLIAAYRGHTPEDIRDIEVARNVDGQWLQPRIPHADRWHFAGCPVNGPHLDTVGSRVALIWFSASEDQPRVRLAFSEDGGSTFASALRVDEGSALGRAQVVLLPRHSALAFWLERRSGATRLVGRRIRDEERLDGVFEVAHGAGLGYPHAIRSGSDVFITWAEGKPVSLVHVAILDGIESEN